MSGSIHFIDVEVEEAQFTKRLGWLLAAAAPGGTTDIDWLHHFAGIPVSLDDTKLKDGNQLGPMPWIPSPSPFSQNLLGNRIVPRVPMRIPVQPDMKRLGREKAYTDLKQQTKIDPRSVRFSEIVQTVLNSLLGSGALYSTGNGEWFILFSPRQVEAADAFNGEIFFDPTLNKLGFKDPIGFVSEIQLNPW